MNNFIHMFFIFIFLSGSANADCNIKKAAINKVADAKIGVSGDCNAKLAIDNKANKTANARKIAKDVKEHRKSHEHKESEHIKSKEKIRTNIDAKLND